MNKLSNILLNIYPILKITIVHLFIALLFFGGICLAIKLLISYTVTYILTVVSLVSIYIGYKLYVQLITNFYNK
jgi:hypothetical protein